MPDEADSLVDLRAFPTEAEAVAVAHALREHGVGALVIGGLLAGFRFEHAVSARVVVPRSQEARARELVAELCVAAEIDWSAVDVGVPEELGPGFEASSRRGQGPSGRPADRAAPMGTALHPALAAGAQGSASAAGEAGRESGRPRRRGTGNPLERVLVGLSMVAPVLAVYGAVWSNGSAGLVLGLSVGLVGLWAFTGYRVMGREGRRA